ncbi:B3 DNA binding domain containing protein, partial [Trema orientale]
LVSFLVYDLLFTPNSNYISLIELEHVIFFLHLIISLVVLEQLVPLNFAMTYIKNQGDVVPSGPNGRYCSAEFKMKPPRIKNRGPKLYNGWQAFVKGKNLDVGDVCIFKLLDGTAILFEVSIVRFTEFAYL